MKSRFAPPPAGDGGDPRALMGYASGWMYLGAALVVLAGLAVPDLRVHPGWQAAVAASVGLYGLITILGLTGWEHRPMRTHVAAMFAALPVIGWSVWATGGARSYILCALLLAPVHWAFFLNRVWLVALLCAGLSATVWAPLVYAPGSEHGYPLAMAFTWTLSMAAVTAAVMFIRRRLRTAEERLRELSELDPLTGLLNRRGFGAALTDTLARTGPSQRTVPLVLDLDHLKRLNDRHGHVAGDQALQLLARRLRGALRADDHAARIGGDEFAFVTRVAGEEDAERLADRIEDASARRCPAWRAPTSPPRSAGPWAPRSWASPRPPRGRCSPRPIAGSWSASGSAPRRCARDPAPGQTGALGRERARCRARARGRPARR